MLAFESLYVYAVLLQSGADRFSDGDCAGSVGVETEGIGVDGKVIEGGDDALVEGDLQGLCRGLLRGKERVREAAVAKLAVGFVAAVGEGFGVRR